MHVPDGFVDAPTSLTAGAVTAAGVAVCLRMARHELGERAAPMAGLVAAFVFAAQMINFPVAGGTSGHLLGGVLAAVLVGPATGALAVTVVVAVQALLFADGGLTALGVNVVDMGLVTVLVGYVAFRALLRVLPARPGSVVVASAVGAFLSVPASALAFTAFFAVGGTVSVPLGTLAGAMVGVHLAIGAGEALITGAVVGSVLAVRPDLVAGARGSERPLVLRAGDGSARSTT